ncbi:MAG: hypothetical protein ACK4QL_08330 [Pseudanabaenaceae cyanobacterium]
MAGGRHHKSNPAFNHYPLWHDRAMFHFLTSPAERAAAYVQNLETALQPGDTDSFLAENAPPRYSGLPVQRYRVETLHSSSPISPSSATTGKSMAHLPLQLGLSSASLDNCV